MPRPNVVVVDFNHSLILESALPCWCRSRLQSGSPRALLDIAVRGPMAVLLDRLPGAELLAARVGLGAFRGATPEEVASWARTALTANPTAIRELARLEREQYEGELQLIVVSRGTPSVAIEAWLAAHLPRFAAEIHAPLLELCVGRFTGRVEAGLRPKRERALLVPDGATFLGDADDATWALGQRDRIHFVRVDLPPDR